MIGWLIEAYCLGRTDAKAGRKPRPHHKGQIAGARDRTYRCYRLGHRDERRRMRAEKRLAQIELWEATGLREGP